MKPVFYAANQCGLELFWAANFSGFRGDLDNIPCKTLQVDFSRHPLLSSANLKAVSQLRSYIREYGIDAIHCNTPLGSTCGRLAARFEHVDNVLYTAHGLLYFKGAPRLYSVFKWVEWTLAHVTDGVVCMNEEDRKAVERLPLRRKRVWKIDGVGIKLQKRDQNIRQSMRAQLNIPEDTIVFLCVGRLERVKDLSTTLRAFSQIAELNTVILICGEGNEEEALKKEAHDLGIENKAVFLGFRDDVREIMAASDVYVMSSLHEGLPRSLMEAMNARLACVVSDARGCVDLIEDGRNGMVCRRGEANDFAAAFKRLIDDAKLRITLSEAAELDSERYGIQNAKLAHEVIYREMFAKGC